MRFLVLLVVLVFFNPVFFCSGQSLLLPSLPEDSVQSQTHFTNPYSSAVIDTIVLTGNKITRRQIILRELSFTTGDTIASHDITNIFNKSKENLLNTSLFNFVTIEDSLITGANTEFVHLAVRITFVERWYLWPFPIFEISDRNFNAWWKEQNFGKVNYGVYLVRENMRGRMETLKLLLRFGYDERYEISYQVPYINRKQTFGAGLGVGLGQNHEIAYQTINNSLISYRDESDYMLKHFYSYFQITHRPTLYHYHTFSVNYHYYTFADTILKLNPEYSFSNQSTNEYITLFYDFILDYRDSKAYPLKGSYSNFQVAKSGFGIFKNGDISMMDLYGNYRKYFELSEKFHLANDFAAKITTNRDQPYYFQKGLGYDRNFVRGYELYVIDGTSYWLLKNSLRYTLIPTTVKDIGFIRSEKFNKIHYAVYVNWFLDAGYVDAYKNYDVNDLANTFLYGTGIGIDLVTYYDLVFRIEFTINRQRNSGVFIHFQSTL